MKIAFISLENPFDKTNNGGIGTYTGVMAKGLSSLKHEVHMITVGQKEMSYIEDGVHVHVIPKHKSKRMYYLEQGFKIYEKMLQLLEQYEIDVIESPEWMAQGLIVASEIDIPIVTRLHTPLFLIEKICNGQRIYRDSEEIKRYERLQAKRSKLVTAPCNSISNLVKDEWGVGSITIPNPINTADYEVNVCDKPAILYMGRLEYRKGVLVLADCIEKLMNQVPNAKLIMCGQDTFYKKKSVKKMFLERCQGCEENIEFIEHADSETKKELMKRVSIVVLPSLWENFSYVCLEAMAQGKTVVATKSGGFIEMIEDGKSGYLVEAGNSQELGSKLEEILLGRLPGTGAEARVRVEECFDIKVLCEEYVKLYRSII